jgi:UBX domain-containing protein 6
MIQSLNTGRDRRKTCIETLHKYITNVVQSPHEEKYRKIRCENRVFVDRVASLRGGREFLAAVGFEETPMAGADGKVESYFHMSEEKATANLQKLKDSLTVLTDTQPIALKLFRNPVVLTQAKADETEKLPVPNEFFDLTVEEMRRALDERQTELDQVNHC